MLYWFRTPPNVKVGREPFDEEARRALQTQNPGVMFDWRHILETPIPSADAEMWRERRRAEKTAKRAAAERKAELSTTEHTSLERPVLSETRTLRPAQSERRVEGLKASESVDDGAQIGRPEQTMSEAARGEPVEPRAEQRRRRRRRGRRGRPADAQPAADAPSEPVEPDKLGEPGSDQ